MQSMKITYNSPVILTFSLLSCLILILDNSGIFGNLISRYFVVGTSFSAGSFHDWFTLFSHALGHADWTHLFGNFTFILLLGPILEEKYSPKTLLSMILLTALVTGIINVLFMSTRLHGASGIVFMFIILASITDVKAKTLPLTFILVALIFLGKEIGDMFKDDSVSQLAHLLGGIAGTAFGFIFVRK